jgi:hypothetical protein
MFGRGGSKLQFPKIATIEFHFTPHKLLAAKSAIVTTDLHKLRGPNRRAFSSNTTICPLTFDICIQHDTLTRDRHALAIARAVGGLRDKLTATHHPLLRYGNSPSCCFALKAAEHCHKPPRKLEMDRLVVDMPAISSLEQMYTFFGSIKWCFLQTSPRPFQSVAQQPVAGSTAFVFLSLPVAYIALSSLIGSSSHSWPP